MAMSVYTDRPTERPANRAASIQVPNQVTKFPVQVQIQVPKLVLNQAPPPFGALCWLLSWHGLNFGRNSLLILCTGGFVH
jgi:hypothetical protein